jgi:integrase
VVGYGPRRRDAAREPSAPAHPGRRWTRLLRTQERFQADHRLAPEGPRSSQDSSQAAGGGELLRATDYEDSGLIFATRKGTPLDAQNVINRHFKPLLKQAGLPPIRWHDLRHTCATLLLGRGVHPKLVQHLLGHASITMTLDRYSHWIPSMGRHAAEGMDEALG